MAMESTDGLIETASLPPPPPPLPSDVMVLSGYVVTIAYISYRLPLEGEVKGVEGDSELTSRGREGGE